MRRFINFLFKITVLTGMLIGLPLLGVYLAGYPVTRYLEFPPKTQFVLHEPFSWVAFAVIALAIAIVVVPMIGGVLKSYRSRKHESNPPIAKGFPWWGCVGVVTGLASWVVAWNRFPWATDFQAHTFVPLWLSYIVVINALTYRRTGRCMMIDRPGFFFCLFPASSAFWWYFEYLNRFVQNWYYIGVEYGPWLYFQLATLSFSTVLPAVLGTREWILSYGWAHSHPNVPNGAQRIMNVLGFDDRIGASDRDPTIMTGHLSAEERGDAGPQGKPRWRIGPWCTLTASGICLALIGVLPNYLFPLVWVSPMIVIVSIQAILGERHVVSDMAEGRWYPSVSAAAAALICGWFWEMWNYYSFAKWEYSIPFVDRFHVFEMPILGYAGYLPFGLECLVVGLMLESLVYGHHGETTNPQ